MSNQRTQTHDSIQPRKHRITLLVSCDRDATHAEIMDYVDTALGSWGGSLDPDDPMFKGVTILNAVIRRENK